MNIINRSAIIISASSDIGAAMCTRWKSNGWKVYGTYRTKSSETEALARMGVKLVYCNLADAASIRDSCSQLCTLCPQWDVLVMCPGTQDPVGAFSDCSFEEWEESLKVNFSSQLRIIHHLLPTRHTQGALDPIVLLFAGGGSNSAPQNYSAYTISKVALIKMCELLDAEIPDTRFTIVGPGWVKTKIHDATMRAGEKAGANYERTKNKLSGNECTPMDEVLDCCDWVVNTPRKSIGGRNISVVFDRWGDEKLAKMLAGNPEMYKLRRYGNDWLVKNERK